MKSELTRKYNLFTAIAMVVGIVIGSGIFYKSTSIVQKGGNILEGILGFVIVGIMMIICSVCFSQLSSRYEKINGIVDYSEVMVSNRFGHCVSWFMATIYFPSLTCILAWLSANFTVSLFGITQEWALWAIAGFYLIVSFVINTLSPVLAGKVQVSTTIIKLIPLVLMAVVGTIYGLTHQTIQTNFTEAFSTGIRFQNLSSSIVALAFAYEGWIIATSINSEIKNSTKNLPIALFVGSLIVVAVYIFYFIGLSGTADFSSLNSSTAINASFEKVFGVFGKLIQVFIIVSCLGTLNGLTLGCCRGVYSTAIRDVGIFQKKFSLVSPKFKMPLFACLCSFILTALWLVYWFAFLKGVPFLVDVSELPIVTVYAINLIIFVQMIRKEKDLKPFFRFVLPILGIISCIVMLSAAVIAHGINIVWYLIQFIFVMAVFFVITFVQKKKTNKEVK
jgi:APA family basic amino acid/polyamine antiporter